TDFVAATLRRAGRSRANRKNLRFVSRAIDEIKGAVVAEKRRGKIECTERQIKGAGTSQPATGRDSFSARLGFGQRFVPKNSRRRHRAHRSRQSSGKRCPVSGNRAHETLERNRRARNACARPGIASCRSPAPQPRTVTAGF